MRYITTDKGTQLPIIWAGLANAIGGMYDQLIVDLTNEIRRLGDVLADMDGCTRFAVDPAAAGMEESVYEGYTRCITVTTVSPGRVRVYLVKE